MIRAYLSAFVQGPVVAGSAPFVSVLSTLVPAGVARHFCDGRPNPGLAAGWALILADVSDAQHATLIADARITYLSIEDAANTPLGGGDMLATIPAAKRTTIRNTCDTRHVPTQHLNGGLRVRHLYRTIKRRFLLRQILGADDFTEGLATLVSAIAPARRQTIRTRLEAARIDFSAVRLTDTIEEALVKLTWQSAAILMTPEG